ncbi:MAG: TIGR00300 family protein, partial [Nocardioidaceae bacterium]
MQVTDTVEITGHLMDSGILSRVLDDIRDYGGDYTMDEFNVGHDALDPSHAKITVAADDDEALQRLLMRLQTHGVNLVDPGEAVTEHAEVDGVFPDGFYSTTNLATHVRVGSRWVTVQNPEMDCGLVVDGEGPTLRVRTVPMADVEAGMRIVCGAAGLRVTPLVPRKEDAGSFGFMESQVSSEKPQTVLVRQVAEGMRAAKANGQKVLWVGGPGV